MLDLGLSRTLVISTLTLAATLATGAAHADPPAAPVAPAAAPAPASPPEAPEAGHVYVPLAPIAPPVYRAPPGYGWPPGYSPAEESPDVDYPPEMRVRSAGMVGGGVGLLSFGLIGLIAGSVLVGAHSPTDESSIPAPCCDDGGTPRDTTTTDKVDPALKTAGIATLVGSVAALGAGTALVVFGAKKVPVEDDAPASAKLRPTVRVGAAGATLRWQF